MGQKNKHSANQPIQICELESYSCKMHDNLFKSDSRNSLIHRDKIYYPHGLTYPISYQLSGEIHYIGGKYSPSYCQVQIISVQETPTATCRYSNDTIPFRDIKRLAYTFANIQL